ncbi:MAG: GntR family transcriptional regulator [Anaerolineales bacterium]
MNNLIENIQLDFRSGTPIYTQIVEQVKQRVLSGELKPGDQLPTVRALALELRVNFNTVARAYRLLDEAGIISTQQGRGTFILDVPPPERTDKLRQQALQALTRDYLNEALRLGCNPDEISQTLSEQLENETES